MNQKDDPEQFIIAIHEVIDWANKIPEEHPKMRSNLVAFTILCMLDGVHSNFNGDIGTVYRKGKHMMLHDLFYDKKFTVAKFPGQPNPKK